MSAYCNFEVYNVICLGGICWKRAVYNFTKLETNINRDKWKISFPVLGNNWLACVLKKYGAPPKFCPAVEQMYTDLKMIL